MWKERRKGRDGAVHGGAYGGDWLPMSGAMVVDEDWGLKGEEERSDIEKEMLQKLFF